MTKMTAAIEATHRCQVPNIFLLQTARKLRQRVVGHEQIDGVKDGVGRGALP